MTDIPPEATPEAITAAADIVDVMWPHEIDAEEAQAIARRMLEVAAPHITAAERERIRQLASDRDATYLGELRPCGCGKNCGITVRHKIPFADLLTADTTTTGRKPQ